MHLFGRAFEHYKRALALDPNHRAGHEHIGEAYLEVGDPENAPRHFAALKSICLLPCEESEDLAADIAARQARGRKPL